MRTFESLHLRDYRLLWAGQMTTSLGLWMDQVTRTFLIFNLTGSPLALGFVSAARGLPLLLFGSIAGVVADRYGRKAQLVISQVVNAILNAVLATLVMTHTVQPWHVYLTGFLAGTVQAFQQPARQVLINDLVGEKYLLNAISLNSAALNLSRGVGPLLSGALNILGADVSYFVQAGMYIFATVWTIQIKIPEVQRAKASFSREEQSFMSSTREGFSYVMKNKIILPLMILGLAPMVLGMPFISLMPVFAQNIFHGGSATQGALSAMIGVGAVIGSLGIASMGRKQGSGKLMMLGAGGFGVFLMLFGKTPWLWLSMIFVFFTGMSQSSYTTQDQTIIQTLAPANLRGRVLGIYLLNRAFTPFGSLLAGVLANYLGGPVAVIIMGASCFVLVLGIRIFAPDIWHLNMEEYKKSHVLASG
ncbi:MAG TPA: MFS transporter [Dehalococcoidales bacterium]|nr:MFS transporter [Dehalococcoidales bacterium]